MVDTPDVIDRRVPAHCEQCGNDLSDIHEQFMGRRQLIDIPPIVPIVTEQQIYARSCTCGHTTCGEYSSNANAPVGYGENIESIVAYLHARQYLPVARMGELFKDILGISISTGGLSHLLKRFARKATPVHDLIREKLQHGPFVGSDGLPRLFRGNGMQGERETELVLDMAKPGTHLHRPFGQQGKEGDRRPFSAGISECHTRK